MGRDLAEVAGIGWGGGRKALLAETGSPAGVGVHAWVQNSFFFIPKSSSLGLTPHTNTPSLSQGSRDRLCPVLPQPLAQEPVAKWKGQEIPIRTLSLSAGVVAGGDERRPGACMLEGDIRCPV